ncbi:MAG: nucleotidyltransferase family protein [Verrucomicrobiales bacterium]|nr:nucleotidyltransferase family protein [Verrucomicrobiales bacterium]MCP5560652.1 nucleotidyltransferase family protein [Verrucomicrobiaceae bacterium]
MALLLKPVSWKRMNDAVEKVRQRLLRVAATLKTAGVPYAVVGGNAVAAWVSRVDESAVRNTRDVDILLRRSDLPQAIEAMRAAGFVHRQVSSLGKAGHMDVFLEGPEAKVRDAVHIVFAGERTLPDSPAENAGIEEAEEADEFMLVTLDALVRMKLAAWRDKDRMHLRDLIDVGLLEETQVGLLPSPLNNRLQFLFDNPDS